MVIVELPEPGAGRDSGAKLGLMPYTGAPEVFKEIAALKPPVTALVMVEVVLVP
jgi:hypothetical protein